MANLIIPDHMQQRLEQYRCFYLSLNPQRRVAWMHRSAPALSPSPPAASHACSAQRQHLRHSRALPHGERLRPGQQGADRQPVRHVTPSCAACDMQPPVTFGRCRYQALVLLLFNERDTVAFADMGRLTGMEDKDLRLTLLSLSMGKPVGAAACVFFFALWLWLQRGDDWRRELEC